MEEHLHLALSRREIAQYLSISERTLTRQVHALTGGSLFARLERLRLARARKLLEDTDSPVETISRLIGYASPAYFCRRFQHATGMTAGAYRAHAAAGSRG